GVTGNTLPVFSQQIVPLGAVVTDGGAAYQYPGGTSGGIVEVLEKLFRQLHPAGVKQPLAGLAPTPIREGFASQVDHSGDRRQLVEVLDGANHPDPLGQPGGGDVRASAEDCYLSAPPRQSAAQVATDKPGTTGDEQVIVR